MKVVTLFDHSTVMAMPWAEAGYECICVDWLHPRGTSPGPHENITLVGVDVTTWDPDETVAGAWFMAAFPPCDHMAVSGARWFKGKGLRKLADAIRLVAIAAEACEQSGARYLIENPVSTLATYWRKPDFMFDPCDYGDPYTKKTCLWVGGGFVMPEKTPVEPTLGSKMHRLPPSPERASLRSRTPEGFARAVFEANRQSG